MSKDPEWFPIGHITDLERLADAIHQQYVNRTDVKAKDIEEILRTHRSQHVTKAIQAGLDDFFAIYFAVGPHDKQRLIQLILSRLDTDERLDGLE